VQSLKSGREPDLERPLHMGPEIDLHLPALLPEDYVGDVHLRLRLYKRIASAPDATALADLQAEMIDRFGILPAPAQTLFRVAGLKLRAAPWGIQRLEVAATGGLVQFAEDHRIDLARVLTLVQMQPQRYRLDGSHRIRFSIESAEESKRIRTAETLLAALGAS
jgi:transcription-repair coupling factor (superfamily II helicase)